MQKSPVFISVSPFKRATRLRLTLLAVASATAASLALAVLPPPALALETSTLPTSTASAAADGGEFSLEPDSKDHEKERKEIETLLQSIESEWNAHNLDKVMSHYADDYVNNDGLDKKAVSALTQDFWRTYPDAKSSSKTKEIRIDGNFATVESRDIAVGSTAKEMPGPGTKGDLNSISEGQLYIKKIGTEWKIIGDRIDFEKVKVSFGLAKKLNASFSAPEQVKSGHIYSAKLEIDLPIGLQAVGSITSQPLEYPQPSPPDKWRQLDGPVLERIMPANTLNRNELLMATIGITNAQRNGLMGITFLTRRLNVVPKADDDATANIAEKHSTKDEKAELDKSSTTPENKSETKTDEKSDSSKDGSDTKKTEEKKQDLDSKGDSDKKNNLDKSDSAPKSNGADKNDKSE